jgi:hypothetical protein
MGQRRVLRNAPFACGSSRWNRGGFRRPAGRPPAPPNAPRRGKNGEPIPALGRADSVQHGFGDHRNSSGAQRWRQRAFACPWIVGDGIFRRVGSCGRARSGRLGCIIFPTGRAHPSSAPHADPTRPPPCWPPSGWPNFYGPDSGRRWFPGTVRGRLPATGVFFAFLGSVLPAGDLVAQRHELFGQ